MRPTILAFLLIGVFCTVVYVSGNDPELDGLPTWDEYFATTFKEHFAAARASGRANFEFKGKIYTTRLAGEDVVTVSTDDPPKKYGPGVCPIITDGTVDTFNHELAHCNGWNHPEKGSGYNPPAKFIHPYDGRLVVTMSRESRRTRKIAQGGTTFRLSKKSPTRLCHELDDDFKKFPALLGCAIVWG